MKTFATLLGMVLMAGQAFGQGQSLDQLLKDGVVVPSGKGQNQPQQSVPQPALAAAGGVGTMFVIAAPRSALPNQSGPMIRMLAGFSFSGEHAAGPEGNPSVQYTKFADRNEGAFTLDVPAGWKVEGGLQRHSTLDVRAAVYATSPDGGTVIRLGDFDLGTFTEPNQALAMAGMREGGTYSPGYGNVWQIRRYLPGPQFAQEYAAKLARDTQAGNVRIASVKPLPEYSKQQNLGGAIIRTMAGEADFNCVRNGRESAGVVVVATTATSMAGGAPGAIWYVSFLEDYVAPADQAPAAEQIARHMTETFQMSVQWQAQQSQTTMRTSQIVRETGERTNKIIMDTYENRQRTLDRTNRNFDDTIRGVVRLRNPDTGDELEGEAGKNYYYKVPNRDRPVGTNRPIEGDPNVTELEQIR